MAFSNACTSVTGLSSNNSFNAIRYIDRYSAVSAAVTGTDALCADDAAIQVDFSSLSVVRAAANTCAVGKIAVFGINNPTIDGNRANRMVTRADASTVTSSRGDFSAVDGDCSCI